MKRLAKRSAIGFLLLIGGLILQALGVGLGAAVAVAGLLFLLVVNIIAPWPWQRDWRD